MSIQRAIRMARASSFRPHTPAKRFPGRCRAGAKNIANLFCVFPAMLAALHFAFRGSARAGLVWLGLLIYVAYSYILYAFFVHFGPWFLVYVAVLGFLRWLFVSAP